MSACCRDLGQLDFNSVVTGVTNVIKSGVDPTKDPLGATLRSVSFYSRYTPLKTYTAAQLNEMYADPTPNPYLKFLQPVVRLDTMFGVRTIAPYGEPDPNEWEENVQELAVGLVGGIVVGVGLAFLAGLAVGRARFA